MATKDAKDEQASPSTCCAGMFDKSEDGASVRGDCAQMMSALRPEAMPGCCAEMAAEWRRAHEREE